MKLTSTKQLPFLLCTLVIFVQGSDNQNQKRQSPSSYEDKFGFKDVNSFYVKKIPTEGGFMSQQFICERKGNNKGITKGFEVDRVVKENLEKDISFNNILKSKQSSSKSSKEANEVEKN